MRSLLHFSVLSLCASISLAAPLSDGYKAVVGRSADLVMRNDKTSHGAVACEAAPCSAVGIDILKQGGNAADSIIATTLCVGVISAYHSGIGGGGFMLVRSKQGDGSHNYEMIDFRETMPAAGNETMYSNNTDKTASTVGGLAVGVPGELRGWEMLHKRHGRLPWNKLFEPAINLARNGFEVNVDLAGLIAAYPDLILNDPLWSETYAPNGTLLKEGDTCYRKRYANTLEKISWYGADYFYKGEMAVNTASAAIARGGILTPADLANYTALIREPVNITYRDTRIFSTVAPSSGAVVLSALKIFEGWRGNYSDTDPEINVTTHRLIEATRYDDNHHYLDKYRFAHTVNARFAYGQRTSYGDPAFVSNVTELQREYLTQPVVESIRSKIGDNQTYPLTYYDPEKYYLHDNGTSHVAVIDGEGNAVSLTTTVNLYWGSQVMTTDGVILNDEMDDFSSPGQTNSFGFAASPSNYIRPGKRPQSSIASSIAENLETGEIRIGTGSAGGSRIITATLQALYHSIDQGLTAPEIEHHPRWHDQLSGKTYFEWKDESLGIAGYDNSTVAYLQGLGYNTTWEDLTGSTSHVVIRSNNGTLSAASDPRKAASGAYAY